MIFLQLLLYLFATGVTCSDWVSDWMNPIQDQWLELTTQNIQKNKGKLFDELGHRTGQLKNSSPEDLEVLKSQRDENNGLSTASLKLKLETTLQNAKLLAESLKVHIYEMMSRESSLKEAIANGRSGVSTLTVSTSSHVPRFYIIRDGHWTLCNGIIQLPVPSEGTQTNLFNELFKEPRCIGREVSTFQDPCVFNSVMKYEVVPTHRGLEYAEEDYLCLKPTFNKTLERYMSVTKQLLMDTCKQGIMRSLAENIVQCGIRVLSDYTFYPYKSSTATSLPLEYCAEKDGSCKLITAWHISNTSVENFEFLKNEHDFKKYFIKSGSPYIEAEHVI